MCYRVKGDDNETLTFLKGIASINRQQFHIDNKLTRIEFEEDVRDAMKDFKRGSASLEEE